MAADKSGERECESERSAIGSLLSELTQLADTLKRSCRYVSRLRKIAPNDSYFTLTRTGYIMNQRPNETGKLTVTICTEFSASTADDE